MLYGMQNIGRRTSSFSNESAWDSREWMERNQQLQFSSPPSQFLSKSTEQNVVYKSPTISFKTSNPVQDRFVPWSSSNPSSNQPWERTLPKAPTKHVRYDPRTPVQFEDWPQSGNGYQGISHMRSSSEQTYRQQRALEIGNNGMDTSFTDYTSPASSVCVRDEFAEPIRPSTEFFDGRRDSQSKRSSQTRTSRPNAMPEASNFRDAIKSMIISQWKSNREADAENDSSRDMTSRFIHRHSRTNYRTPTSSVKSERAAPVLQKNTSNNGTYEFAGNRQVTVTNPVRGPPTGTYSSSQIPRHPSSHHSASSTSSYSSYPTMAARSESEGNIMPIHRCMVDNQYSMSTMPRTMETSWTAPSAHERAMDYHSRGMNGYGNSHACSGVTSPTHLMKGSAFGTPYGGSKSSGQPSPSSVIDELQGRFRNAGPQNPNQRPILRNPSIDYTQRKTMQSAILSSQPHHQSELSLTTSSVPVNYQVQYPRGIQTISSTSATRLANMEQVVRPPETFDSVDSSSRGGPSFRRLQTLYGTSPTQKRYPSDNTLDKTYLNEKAQLLQQQQQQQQYYVSGRKAGTVKIHVRSRSAQASPSCSPAHSPRQSTTSRFANGGFEGNHQQIQPSYTHFQPQVRQQQFFNSEEQERIRSRELIVPTSINRVLSSPPRVEKPKNISSSADGPQTEEDEFQMLPSVREIIRQVEEMTQKNENTLPKQPIIAESRTTHQSRSLARGEQQLRDDISLTIQPRSISMTSAKTSSNNCYQSPPPRQVNVDGGSAFYANPEQHPHPTPMQNATGDNKWSNFGRNNQYDFGLSGTSTPIGSRKADLLSNLPQDYQKLRESFLEQRREIQRLRKELADKEKQLNDLQKDIHLYEPWR